MTERERPGEAWRRRMVEEEPEARRHAASLAADFPEGSDVNLFYTDLLAGPDESHPDPMAGWTPSQPTAEHDKRYSEAVRQFASQLDLPADEFIEIFGLDWRPLGRAGSLEQDQEDLWKGPWFVSGDPAQLLMRESWDGVELAMPRGQWQPPNHLATIPTNAVVVRRDTASTPVTQALVADMLKRRRAGFRYCRFCHDHVPPERRERPDCCYGCAEVMEPRDY